MRLSIDEISDWKQFEDLVDAYFRKEEGFLKKNIVGIEVNKSGTGPDEGHDLILDILVTDGVMKFHRKWIVQCKFYEKDIAPSDLNENNIPSLIHSYGAVGYLLICKRYPTAKLTSLFTRLNKECKFSYKYEIWSGEQFCLKIQTQDNEAILKRYFPKYFARRF